MPVTVCRKASFNAAHRLHNDEWDAETNEQIFGKCNHINYHGHNYDLLVKITGEIDPKTGYVFDLKRLKQIIDNEVCEKLDHKNLNLDVPEFKHLNPTAENIAVLIWDILRSFIDISYKLSITLYETNKNFVEYAGK